MRRISVCQKISFLPRGRTLVQDSTTQSTPEPSTVASRRRPVLLSDRQVEANGTGRFTPNVEQGQELLVVGTSANTLLLSRTFSLQKITQPRL